MTKFELDRLADYSEESILAEIRRVAALAPDGPLCMRALESHARVKRITVVRKFGTWHAALERAGLGHRYGGAPVARFRAGLSARALSDEALLDELRAAPRRSGSVS